MFIQTIGPFTQMSIEHITFMIFYWIIAIFTALMLRHKSKKSIYTMLIILTCIFTPIELLKTLDKILADPSNVKGWIEYPFCSLFVPSLILSLFKNKHISKLGLSFLSFGACFGGMMYITYPGGGIIDYPLFEIKTLYRTFYHFCMLSTSLTILFSGYFTPNIKDYKYYTIFMSIAIIPSLIINNIFETNLLFLDNPIGAFILNDIYLWNNIVYTILVILAEGIGFYFLGYGIYKLVNKLIKKESLKRDSTIQYYN